MKIALAQMCMDKEPSENLSKSLYYCDQAKGCDLLFFPEIQLTPFFPQYHDRCVDDYCMDLTDDALQRLCQKAREHQYFLSPNVYLASEGKRYDASLWITPDGEIQDVAKMVHIAQNVKFYEQDYYTPSEDGFKVFQTPYGKVGIVICFDRHLPESIRTCALKGADLVIIPTANTKAEPMELFEWEMRVQAMQNQVFIAMCNRVGTEDQMEFAGESIVIDPRGNVVAKADDQEQLLICEIDLREVKQVRSGLDYLSLRRPEQYVSSVCVKEENLYKK